MRRVLFSSTLAMFCTALISCGGGSSSSLTPDSAPTPTPTPTSTLTPTPTPTSTSPVLERVSNTNCVAPAETTGELGEFELTPVFNAQGFPELPGLVGLYQAPNDANRWYAVQRSGTIVRFENNQGTTQVDTFLSLDGVDTDVELGLLSMAFHPNYQSNGYIYVYYNDEDNSGASVISRFTSVAGAQIDPNSEQVLLTLSQPAANHNGGDVHFGPDGYLYIGFGDGGGSNDQFGHGQNTESWHGSLLRIDVDNPSSGRNYGIPNTNPFANDPNYLPEIYAYGLRNPWRFSFDSVSGNLWVADVGQNEWEEVSIVSSGDNLGWPTMEASTCFESDTCNQNGLTLPVLEYDHSDGHCSVSGGHVYRNQRITGLNGSYIYGDFCSGAIWRGYWDGTQWRSQELVNSGFNISAFGRGNDGEVYVLNIAGTSGESIYRFDVRDGGGATDVPERLSDTGCFQSTSSKTYDAAVVPYDVSSELWSDGAIKRRGFAVPDNAVIDIDDDGDFNFPMGSVLIKDFLIGERYVETRLYMRHQRGWSGYSYEWLDNQSDAVLLREGKTVNIDGSEHIFPSSNECQSCHTAVENVSLGLEAAQLNMMFNYGGVDGSGEMNQLDALHTAGFVDRRPQNSDIAELVSLTDSNASIGARARSYLHSNCSGCHQPDAPGALLDLRITTDLDDMGGCGVPPNAGELGIVDARLIDPGNADRSVLLARMEVLDADRMPPLASRRVDTDAVSVVREWINSLSDCQ